MRLYLILLFICILANQSIAQFQKGCIDDKFKDRLLRKINYPKTRGNHPSSYTLSQFLPPVGNQDNLGSCTSWACAYAGLTILKRYENSNISYPYFNPLNLHNRLKVSNNFSPCTGGNSIYDALLMLKNFGCEKYYYDDIKCKYINPQSSYNDKLFDFNFLGISENNFKSALNENNPIIISMYVYKNGWDKNVNIVNGVWNGYNEGHNDERDGFHAMCIVGYDDRKEGGAFKIMNSWGSYWGVNGFFWLKYSDLFSIREAYSLTHTPYNQPNPVINKNIFKTKFFRIYNTCNLTTYISFAKKTNGNWKAEGWFPVKPGGYHDYYIGDRENPEVYWMALAQNSKYWWYSTEESGKVFCYDPENAFTKNEFDYCSKTIKYHYFNAELNSNGEIASESTECPKSISRGAEIEINQKVSELKFDNRRQDSANKYWKKDFLLLDYFTGKPISPTNLIPKYNIWYINDNKNVINKIGEPEEIEKINYLKFATKESAEAFLQTK